MAKTIYCYVDETGQDTKGKLFIVVTIIVAKDQVEAELGKIEKILKISQKWRKTQHSVRVAYLQEIAKRSIFRETTFAARFPESGKAFVDLTILAVAKSLKKFGISNSDRIVITIDGLRKNERIQFAAGLRKLGIRPRKVRGGREQSSALLRMADMLVGLARDATEQKKYAKEIYRKLITKKILTLV